MWIVTVAILFCGGVLAATSLIVSRKPSAKELIDKLVPYQGFIGVAMFVWGIYDVIHMFSALKLISLIPVTVIVVVVGSVTELVLGFLLGFGLITKYALSKNEQAKEKGQRIRGKLVVFQAPLGICAIVVSLYLVLVNVFHVVL
jgi:hypothetical protein